MKTIRLGDEIFEVKKHLEIKKEGNNLFSVYERPSARKIKIFNYWEDFFVKNGFSFFINSHNSNIFTIGAKRLLIFNGKERIQKILITPAHNYIANEEV